MPRSIHRKNYFDDLKETRIFAPEFFQDKNYKIQDLNFYNPKEKLKEILDTRFSDHITAILINEEEKL